MNLPLPFTRRSGRVTLFCMQYVSDMKCNPCLLEIDMNYWLYTIVSIHLQIEAPDEVHVISFYALQMSVQPHV